MAHWLRDHGYEAYAIVGGVAAAQGRPVPLEADAPFGMQMERVAMQALATLRHRPFRLYSIGVMCSFVGSWIESAAFLA